MLLLCSCRSWFAAAIGWGAQCRCCSVSAGGPFGAAPRQGVMRSLYLQEGGGLCWPGAPAWGGGGCLPSIRAASSSTFTGQS